MGIKASGRGVAEASQGACLKDQDDYAYVGRVSASGVDFSWASLGGDTENALCMKAEATIDLSITQSAGIQKQKKLIETLARSSDYMMTRPHGLSCSTLPHVGIVPCRVSNLI